MASKVVKWPKILLLGDSQTQYGFSRDGCWLSIIADHFQRRCELMNRGFSGYNIRWLKIMLPQLIDADLAKTCAAVTLFMGSNDANPKSSLQHVPIEEYRQSVKDIVQHIVDLGVRREKIVLIAPPAVDCPLWSKTLIDKGDPDHSLTNEVTGQYAAACSDAAAEVGVDHINLYTEMMKDEDWKKYVNVDGLHLAEAGGELLAQQLIPKLEKITTDCKAIFPDWKNIDSENPSASLQK